MLKMSDKVLKIRVETCSRKVGLGVKHRLMWVVYSRGHILNIGSIIIMKYNLLLSYGANSQLRVYLYYCYQIKYLTRNKCF